MTADKKH